MGAFSAKHSVLEPRDFRLSVSESPVTRYTDGERIRSVICIDVDAFECQVWVKKKCPENSKSAVPIVVVNPGCVILTVNYTAKARGFSRSTTWKDLRIAKRAHKDLLILETGQRFGRWDTFMPHVESDKILGVIMATLNEAHEVPVERASPDECFIEVGESLRQGNILYPKEEMNKLLSRSKKADPNPEHRGQPKCVLEAGDKCYWGSSLAELQRCATEGEEAELIDAGTLALYLVNQIEKVTGYRCSAGVGPNRQLSKLACTLRKPEAVTMLTTKGFQRIKSQLPHKSLDGLKSKTGEKLKIFVSNQDGIRLKIWRYVKRKVNVYPLLLQLWGYFLWWLYFFSCGVVPRPPSILYTDDLKVERLQELSIDNLKDFYDSIGGSPSPEQHARKLHSTIHGRDPSVVQHKLFNASMSVTHSFRGARTLSSWRQTRNAMELLARDMWSRFLYLVLTQRRLPKEFIATVKLKGEDGKENGTKGSAPARLPLNVNDKSIDSSTLRKLLIKLVETGGYRSCVTDIDSVKLSAKGIEPIDVSSGVYYESGWLENKARNERIWDAIFQVLFNRYFWLLVIVLAVLWKTFNRSYLLQLMKII